MNICSFVMSIDLPVLFLLQVILIIVILKEQESIQSTDPILPESGLQKQSWLCVCVDPKPIRSRMSLKESLWSR